MKSIVEKLDEKIKFLKEKFGNNFFSKKTDSNVKMCEIFNAKNGNLNKLDNYNCENCKNRGSFMRISQDGYPINVPFKCIRTRAMLKNLKKSGLYADFKKFSLDNFSTSENWQENIKNSALNFLKEKDFSWFFIGGQSGCGKTHICTAITTELLKQNKTAHYMLWRDEINKLKSVIMDFEKYSKLINKLKTVDVLYIDDLFKTGNYSKVNKVVQMDDFKLTSSDINIVFEVLNSRYASGNLITIISSEKTIKDIIKIDEAIAGRIIEKTGSQKYCLNIEKDFDKNFRFKYFEK